MLFGVWCLTKSLYVSGCLVDVFIGIHIESSHKYVCFPIVFGGSVFLQVLSV